MPSTHCICILTQSAQRAAAAKCIHVSVDDLHTLGKLSCAHERKTQGQLAVQSIGVANRNKEFVTLVGMIQSINAASYLPISRDLLCFQVA